MLNDNKERFEINRWILSTMIAELVTENQNSKNMAKHIGAYAAMREYNTVGAILPRQVGKTTFCVDAFDLLKERGYNVYYFGHNQYTVKEVAERLKEKTGKPKSSFTSAIYGASALDESSGQLRGHNWFHQNKDGEIVVILDEVSVNRFHNYVQKYINPTTIEKMRIFYVGTAFV